MRILILNPNTTEEVTSLMLKAGRAAASPEVELTAITAPRGFPYITTRAEAQIGGAIALEMLAETKGRFDAAILAAFGDPGLLGARELFDFPVVGVSEAAMLTACMMGGQFLIVTFASALTGWYRDCVAMHRLESRCAGVVALDRRFGSLEEARETNWQALVDLANAEIAERDADVAILAGAPLAGLAAKARDHDLIRVPVVDPVAAAVRQAEALVALRMTKASRGSFRRPAAKATTGLALPLAAHVAHLQ
jgi:allantoin racemase